MRKITIVFICFICLLVAGVCIVLSDLGGESDFHATGRLMMDDAQWEQFKIDLYHNGDADLEDVEVLNAGGDKLVQFDNLRVSEDFKYGEVTEDFSKRYNRLWYSLEFCLVLIGGIGVFLCGLLRL